jgi:hypothetical protein
MTQYYIRMQKIK